MGNEWVTVIDSPMGMGKSTWALIEILTHPDDLYMVVVQSIEETERYAAQIGNLDNLMLINSEVMNLARKENSNLAKYDLNSLIEFKLLNNNSVVITHAMFTMLNSRVLAVIESMGVCLILDETLNNMFDQLVCSKADIDILKDKSLIYTEKEGNTTRWKVNNDIAVPEIMQRTIYTYMQNKECFTTDDEHLVISVFPDDVFRPFKRRYVLTYMFAGSHLDSYLGMKGYSIQSLTLFKDEGVPFVSHDKIIYSGKQYSTLIDIVDDRRLNTIGERTGRNNPLSKGWFASSTPLGRTTLRNSAYNFFHNKVRSDKAESNMVGLFKDTPSIQTNGYYVDDGTIATVTTKKGKVNKWRDDIIVKPFKDIPNRNIIAEVAMNERATNKYSNKQNLAYLVNVFNLPSVSQFLNESGYPIDDERIALSTLVQWIWRSRIRNGEPIKLYLPSERMRTLLDGWLSS